MQIFVYWKVTLFIELTFYHCTRDNQSQEKSVDTKHALTWNILAAETWRKQK